MVDWPIGHSTNHSVEIYITRVDEMSRKILPAIICVTLISLLMVTIDDSEAYTGEEFTVDGVIYSLVSDSEVNVAGADSSVENVSIGKQVEYQGHTFTIGGLERGAFQSNQNIKTVSIDSSFDTIARDAFADCNSLTQVTLCNSVSTIDIGAFRGCTSLSNIEGTVKYVFASSFAGCTSLSSMPFVNTLVYIHDNAFRECTSLKEVTISHFIQSNPSLSVMGDDDLAMTVYRNNLKEGDPHRTYRIDWTSFNIYYKPAGVPTYSYELSITFATNFCVNAIKEWYEFVVKNQKKN